MNQSNVPPIGIHEGVEFEEYRSWDAVNQSRLTAYTRSPLHGKWAEDHREETDAMRFGTAAHCLLLEPEHFRSRFHVARELEGPKTTNPWKKMWDEDKATAKELGLGLIDWKEAQALYGMRDSVLNHETARLLLQGDGLTEVCIVWRCAVTGLLCKARIDRVTKLFSRRVVVDLKSSEDARPQAMSRSMVNYGYGRQGAFYLEGINALDPDDWGFIQIVVEKDGPWATAVYEIEEESLAIGRDENAAARAIYQKAKANDSYPGYGQGVGTLSLPPWAKQFHGEAA